MLNEEPFIERSECHVLFSFFAIVKDSCFIIIHYPFSIIAFFHTFAISQPHLYWPHTVSASEYLKNIKYFKLSISSVGNKVI